MNLEEEVAPPPLLLLPLPCHLPPHRVSSTCPRHPEESFTGFCPSCLCERLATLQQSTPPPSSSTTKPSITNSNSTTAALKAIFRTNNKPSSSSSSSNITAPALAVTSSTSNSNSNSSIFPELRRCKSFSGGKPENFSRVFEPQRRSCDVRGRSSLSTLFNQNHDVNKSEKREIEVIENNKDLGFSGGDAEPVFENPQAQAQDEDKEEEDIRVPNVNFFEEIIQQQQEEEIVQVQEEEDQEKEEKTMKDHIDIDTQTKKQPPRDFKEIAGSFWTAASVFSKKLQKWRRKHKGKKRDSGVGDGASTTMQVEKPYSEIADYGFGRRSCDIAPRFSLDAARMSFDASRISFDDPTRASWDEPRASWDGYMIGRMFPKAPPMVSVVEQPRVGRSDDQIPVEEGDTTPGGSAQTRDYYSDSSSSQRRRRSLDRSNSIRKKAAAVVAELDEGKPVPNAKVTPATNEIFHGSKVVIPDRNLRDLNLNSNSLRDDRSESFEFRDDGSIASSKGLKKSRRWSKAWNIWGLILRRSGSKEDEDDRYSRGNVVQRSFSESWPELRREVNGDARAGFNPIQRSNSSVSSRNSFNMGGSFGSMRKSSAEANGHGKKKKEECVLERNRSARYSPNDVDNGILRFYLTPMRNSRRNGVGKGKPKTSHSIANNVLRLH